MSKTASIISLVAIVLVTAGLALLGIFGLPIGVYDILPFSKSISQGLDLKGGVYAVYEAKDTTQADLASKISGAMRIMRNRLDSQGYTEATISTADAKGTRIRVEIPGVKDPDEVFKLIGTPAKLQFKDPAGNVVMEGERVKTAKPGTMSGKWVVNFELDTEGAKQFGEATAKLVGQPLSIYLDGKEISSPTVNTPITGGAGYIEGPNFNEGSATELAAQLQSGALPLELTQLEARTVSATLGVDALKTSVEAGVIGLLLVILFMIGFYRLPGLLANISLIVHTVLLLYLLAILGVQLTLPGVAGIILGIGMSVDANVIIFARIKDEMVLGKTLRSAVDSGFRKAFTTILDSNMTNILAGVVLAVLGTGPVKGFAYTMILGVVLSMFTAITLTRFLMNVMIKLNVTTPWLYSSGWKKKKLEVEG